MVDGDFHLMTAMKLHAAKHSYYITFGRKRKVFSYIINVKFGVVISRVSENENFLFWGASPLFSGGFAPFLRQSRLTIKTVAAT